MGAERVCAERAADNTCDGKERFFESLEGVIFRADDDLQDGFAQETVHADDSVARLDDLQRITGVEDGVTHDFLWDDGVAFTPLRRLDNRDNAAADERAARNTRRIGFFSVAHG